ncbi:type II toxin-antitoxin system VapC family toxin [Rhizobium sp.]|uniref:type II toxin-antitoxin system VapC family toxin n=1 Tax=Rhizobium sp. TaxID=391 RepID=UPI002F031F6A
MRVLFDTHIVLALLGDVLEKEYPRMASRLLDPATVSFVSVATLWEMAIKTRLGKLDPGMPLEDIPGHLEDFGVTILSIEPSHALTAADPEPASRDPFDRLLLAQCQVEGLKLATVDRALAHHHLALKA